jgi:membrane-bound serine protease (ClpP class)
VSDRTPSDASSAFVLASFCALLALAAPLRAAAEAPAEHPRVELIRIEGSINPAVAHYISDALEAARAQRADALIIELDTPGGLMSSAERIVKDILGAAIPVIVYVAPAGARAVSAGTFIVLAANITAMAPGTTIGAAHPITAAGGEIKGALGVKVENAAASFAKALARERGRNQEWVEQAVRRSVSIGEDEALSRHVIDLVAPSLNELLAAASGRTVVIAGQQITLKLKGSLVHRRAMTLGQRMLNVLADPNLAYLLLMAGLLGLYFEFAHPGVVLPGVAGAISLLLALAALEMLAVKLSALLLVFLGVAMLIAEAFGAGYGVLGLGGVVALIFGSLLLVDSSRSDILLRREIVYAAAGSMAAIILVTGFLAARTRRRAAIIGREGLVGETGEVRSPVAPARVGTVFVHGELWRATSDEELEAGARIRVCGIRGLDLKVKRAR